MNTDTSKRLEEALGFASRGHSVMGDNQSVGGLVHGEIADHGSVVGHSVDLRRWCIEQAARCAHPGTNELISLALQIENYVTGAKA